MASRVVFTEPELLATWPNEVWSWDITKLKGPAKWTCYYLYVILDIFSRYLVGWMIAARGSSMKSKVAAQLPADLGVTKTHSRPPVSNSNPFPESRLKTMKHRLRAQFQEGTASLDLTTAAACCDPTSSQWRYSCSILLQRKHLSLN